MLLQIKCIFYQYIFKYAHVRCLSSRSLVLDPTFYFSPCFVSSPSWLFPDMSLVPTSWVTPLHVLTDLSSYLRHVQSSLHIGRATWGTCHFGSRPPMVAVWNRSRLCLSWIGQFVSLHSVSHLGVSSVCTFSVPWKALALVVFVLLSAASFLCLPIIDTNFYLVSIDYLCHVLHMFLLFDLI